MKFSEGIQVESLSWAAISANSCSNFNAKWIHLTVLKLFCFPGLLKTLIMAWPELFEKIYNSTDDVLAYLFVVFMSHEINKWFFCLETKQLMHLLQFIKLLFLCVKQYVFNFWCYVIRNRPGWIQSSNSVHRRVLTYGLLSHIQLVRTGITL